MPHQTKIAFHNNPADRVRWSWSSLIFAAVLCTQSGCLSLTSILTRKESELDTTLLESQGYSLPPGGLPTDVKSKALDRPSIVLEIRGRKDARHLERIPLTSDQGVFAQDIVKQARLHEEFGPLRISIMRPSPTGGPMIRMDLQTDEDGNTTSMATNYALLPGDHLIVTEDSTSSPLERFIKAGLGVG